MKIFRNILMLIAFISLSLTNKLSAQKIDFRTKTETKPSSEDNNAIKIGSKKNKKRRKKLKVSDEEIKEAAETKTNARFRKKKSSASKKCKKKVVNKSCKKKNALLDRKKK